MTVTSHTVVANSISAWLMYTGLRAAIAKVRHRKKIRVRMKGNTPLILPFAMCDGGLIPCKKIEINMTIWRYQYARNVWAKKTREDLLQKSASHVTDVPPMCRLFVNWVALFMYNETLTTHCWCHCVSTDCVNKEISGIVELFTLVTFQHKVQSNY